MHIIQKKYNYLFNEKNIYLLNNISYSCNNMKIYTISKKKYQKKIEITNSESSNAFLRVKMRFFGSENYHNNVGVNLVDLIIIFLWLRRTAQSEFSIKYYDHLNLR
jgi:hypothetical protein